MKKINYSDDILHRSTQILCHKDITFEKIFVPYWKEHFSKHKLNKVLEIGCGLGYLSKILSSKLCFLYALDKASDVVSFAMEHNFSPNVKYINNDILTYDSEINFDGCFAHMSVHSIKDLDTLFANVYKLLRKDASFSFSIPHPCFYHLFRPKEMKEFSYLNVKEYDLDFNISLDQMHMHNKIKYYHRAISVYMEIAYKHKFRNISIDEIYPTEDIMKLYPEIWDYPKYIVFKLKK